jgi:glucose/arabinose dehydrogenase
MKKVAIGLALLVIAVFGACRYLLPERFAVNAPVGHILLGRGGEAPASETIETRFRVPKGYSIQVYAEGIPNVRMLRFTRTGELLVSRPRAGEVVLLDRDRTGDGQSDGRTVLLSDLNRPHGLELRDGWLYVGEADAIGRIRFDLAGTRTSGSYERIVTGLPAGGNHWTRTPRFGPDGLLYVGIGSSCNVCVEEDSRRGSVLRFRADGSGEEVYATGLRNTVGIDWRPGTSELYGTDNGRDLLGDDMPPCELNRIVQGGDYGWPYANGNRVPDPDFGAGQQERIAASTPPAFAFRAHNAPLGMTFIRRGDLHPELRGAALVALHGSWNRTKKDGYKVVSLHWDEAGAITERDFMVGFLHDDDVVGRPVDVAEGPDGAIYVSDDYAGVIWRVARESGGRELAAVPTRSRLTGDPLDGIPPADRQTLTARGAALYDANECATCHESQRAGRAPLATHLGDVRARFDVDGMEAFLRIPTPPMPAPPLDDVQRRALAVYLLREPDEPR